jgi:hypothetical protein
MEHPSWAVEPDFLAIDCCAPQGDHDPAIVVVVRPWGDDDLASVEPRRWSIEQDFQLGEQDFSLGEQAFQLGEQSDFDGLRTLSLSAATPFHARPSIRWRGRESARPRGRPP